MLNPFFLMAALFAALAALTALDNALMSVGLMPAFSGIRWLRVHLVTLGILAETAFGLLPALVAWRSGAPHPPVRWDIWLLLNAGLLVLLIGIPLFNGPLIIVGGSLILVAAVLLLSQVQALGARAVAGSTSGSWFYRAGLAFLLVGVFIGIGLWNGWAEPLRIAVPIEAHIHANVFGFLTLTVAGLLIDLAPTFTGRPLSQPRAVSTVVSLMSAGALLLVLAPWTGIMQLNLPGIALHVAGTVWLLALIVRPVLGDRRAWTPGLLHLTTGYLWYLAPVVVAPLIITGVIAEAESVIEQSAPQALIFGWAAQIGYALVPYALGRLLQPGLPPRLGGSYVSLASAHLGGVAIWASILVEPLRASLYGLAYVCWAVSLVVLLVQAWRIIAGAGQPSVDTHLDRAAA